MCYASMCAEQHEPPSHILICDGDLPYVEEFLSDFGYQKVKHLFQSHFDISGHGCYFIDALEKVRQEG